MKRLAVFFSVLILPIAAAMGLGSLFSAHALADAGSPNASQICTQYGNFDSQSHGKCVTTFRSSQLIVDQCNSTVAAQPMGHGYTYPYYVTFVAYDSSTESYTLLPTQQINSFGECVSTFSSSKNFFLQPYNSVFITQTPL